MKYFKQDYMGDTLYWELMGEGKEWQLNFKKYKSIPTEELLERFIGMVKHLVTNEVIELSKGCDRGLIVEEMGEEIKIYKEKVKIKYVPLENLIIAESKVGKGDKVFHLSEDFIYVDPEYMEEIVAKYYQHYEDGERWEDIYSNINTGYVIEVKNSGIEYEAEEVKFNVAPDNSFMLVESGDMEKPLYVGKEEWVDIGEGNFKNLLVKSRYVTDIVKAINLEDTDNYLYIARMDVEDMRIRLLGVSDCYENLKL